MPPIATAIITVFNEEQYIRNAVRSLLEQSLQNIEILVIDDGSSDRTPEILREFDDDRLRIETPGRLGRAGALAYAAEAAGGKYIGNLDADDEAMPERFKAQVEFLETHPEYFWVGCGVERVDSQRNEHVVRHYAESNSEIRKQAAKCIPYCHSAIMFRRDLMQQGVNYDPNQKYLIDFEFFLRVALRGKVANLPEILAKRRVRDESYFQRSFSRSRQKRRMAQLCFKAVRQFKLPPHHYAYPLMHMGYPLIPPSIQRRMRAWGGISEQPAEPS